MSKKVKALIWILVVLVLLTVVSIPFFSWLNKQEFVVVTKAFGVPVRSSDDLIYFDDFYGDNPYWHAAYGVDENRYEKLFAKMEKKGYTETTYNEDENLEWVPFDRISTAYSLDEMTVYVTELSDGIVEMYFVKQ